MIRVRIANSVDVPNLVRFIEDHWSPQHVFVHRPEVFRWQHEQPDGRVNMVVAEDTESDDPVMGVLGFIPMGRFAPELGDRDLMLAIWKVRDDGVPPGVGLRLLKFLRAELRPRMISAIGTSQMVRPIYEVLGYQVGALAQAALFHPHREGSLRIATGVPASAFAVQEQAIRDVTLHEVADHMRADFDAFGDFGAPAKNWRYVEERYLRHPWYRYEVRAAIADGDVVGGVVWRMVEAEDSRILRIVDVLGDPTWMASAGAAFQAAVMTSDAEYIDIMQWGVDATTLASGGFVARANHPEMVLPNYFAPFESRNVEIELAFRVFDSEGDDVPVRLFRADSDQDRPNLVREVDAVG